MFVVAGVTGNVGGTVARELLAKGQKVRVLVREPSKGVAWAKLGAEVAIGSLEDAASMTSALKGETGFFTLIPPNYAVPDFYAYQRKLSDAIAQAVKASGVPHVVMLSSVGADLAQGNGPIKGLHHLENVLRATGTVLTAIRAGSFQENVANSLAPARAMGIYPNFMPSADAAMPMIATKDIGALAAEQLALHPSKSEVIDLHGPAYSTRQVAEKLGAALGKQLNIVQIPETGWLDAMTKAGFPPHVAEIFAEMYRGFISGAIVPKGDRMVQGNTTLDETLKTLLASR
jgi:uncharacterized protein YbjT (DUF2867 family)